MSFDDFIDHYHDELVKMWRESIHYVTTDFDRFLEIKYDAYIKRGSI